MTDEEKETIVRRVAAGESYRDVAGSNQSWRNIQAITNVVNRYKKYYEPDAIRHRNAEYELVKPPMRLQYDLNEQFAKDWVSGQTLKEIAERHGTSQTTVRACIRRYCLRMVYR